MLLNPLPAAARAAPRAASCPRAAASRSARPSRAAPSPLLVAAAARPARRPRVAAAASTSFESSAALGGEAGRVKPVECAEWKALAASGWVMLDVRPPEEVARCAVPGSVNVPLYMVDPDTSLGGLLKQSAAFGTGGWWLGGAHMKTNPDFLAETLRKLPKDKPVVVACQKGLRSLTACEQLVKAGYPTVAWLSGGFDAAAKEHFDSDTGKDMRYGSVAGVSGMIGWTKVQQEEGTGALGGGLYNVLGVVAVIGVLNYISIAWQFLQATPPAQ